MSSITSTPSPTSSSSSTLSGSSHSTTFPTTSQSVVTASPVGSAVPSGDPNAGAGNGGGFGGNTLATSAPLYLYTFLATLVLLLSVSAAIVIRSFIVRRRHRLMVEEAIRNGTYVPPGPPGAGRHRPHVDLSLKPQLWDAYLGGGAPTFTPMDMTTAGRPRAQPPLTSVWRMEADGKREDWDNIKPIYAAYVNALPTSTGPTNRTTLSTTQNATNNTTIASTPAPNAASASTRQRGMRNIASRVVHAFNPTPDPTSPLPAPANANANDTSTTPNQRQTQNANANNNEFAMTQIFSSTPTAPAVVRVAVMIAMPTPPSHRSTNSTHSASRSPTPSTSSPHPTSASPLITAATLSHPLQNASASRGQPSEDDEEVPLPHLELGVAEIEISTVASDSSSKSGKSLKSSGSGSEEMEGDVESPIEEVRVDSRRGRA